MLAVLVSSCSAITPWDQCHVTSDCLARGPAFAGTFCTPDHACVPYLSQDCSTLLGDPLGDDTILLGHLISLSGSTKPFGDASVPAAGLALNEFHLFMRGIPVEAGRSRPITLLVCNDQMDAVRAARHLVYDMRVPILFGPTASGDVIKVAKDVTIPGGTLLITPIAASPLITTLDDNDLVWRTSISYSPTEPEAISALLAQLDPGIRQGLMPGESVRVALIAQKGNVYSSGLTDEVFKYVSMAAGKTFKRKDLPDSSVMPLMDVTPEATEIKDFKPHVVLGTGAADIAAAIGKLEELWPTGPARPIYLLSEGVKVPATLMLAVKSQFSLSKRIRVFAPRVNPELNLEFGQRWTGMYMTGLPDIYGTATTYDALYLSAYALVALGGATITGANLAQAMKRLVPPGLPIDAGPTNLDAGIREIRKGNNIDYNGVSGRLDFDTSTGDSLGDYDILCIGNENTYKPSGQYFDASKLQLVGAINPAICP